MFSSTTIASSITTPTASASASSVMVLSVKPKIHMKPKVPISEIGIAAATINVGRVRRRNTKTVRTASSAPKISANCVSATDSRIDFEKSAAASCSLNEKPTGSSGRISLRRL